MTDQRRYFISPTSTHEKLQSPTFADCVDVFEERMGQWMIEPAEHLAQRGHGEVPAVALVLPYFEAIEIYRSGQDSSGASKAFFRKGFQDVFHIAPALSHLYDQVVDALYVQVRCGFAHEGPTKNRLQ